VVHGEATLIGDGGTVLAAGGAFLVVRAVL
jgi:hypothetical protein